MTQRPRNIARSNCASERPFCVQTLPERANLKKIERPALALAVWARAGGPNGLPRRLLGRFGDHFRTIFERFRGRTSVRTKKARPLRNTGRSDRIRRPGLPRATQKRPKLAPGVSRERLSEKNNQKSRLGASRAHFSVAPGGPGGVRGRPEALRGRPESSPSASRSVPGAPAKPPESPQIAPRAPGSELGRLLVDFWWISVRLSLDVRSVFVPSIGRSCLRAFHHSFAIRLASSPKSKKKRIA